MQRSGTFAELFVREAPQLNRSGDLHLAQIENLLAFARREKAAARWKPAQDGPIENEWRLPEIPTALQGAIKPRQWKPTALDQFTARGQQCLEALRQQHPKIEETWWLLNGRRSAREVCERSPFPPEAVLAYLELLHAEDKI